MDANDNLILNVLARTSSDGDHRRIEDGGISPVVADDFTHTVARLLNEDVVRTAESRQSLLEAELREWVSDCICQHFPTNPLGCGRCRAARGLLGMPNENEETS